MGPVNWLAVLLSANLAIAVGFVWYGPLFGGAPLFGRATAADVTQENGAWLGLSLTAMPQAAFRQLTKGNADPARIGFHDACVELAHASGQAALDIGGIVVGDIQLQVWHCTTSIHLCSSTGR